MEGSKLAKTQEGDQAGFKSSALHDSHKPSFMRVSVGNMINSTDQATPVAGASVKKAISGTSTLPTKPKLKVSQVWPDRQQENAKLGSSDDAKLTTPNIPKTGLPSYSGNDVTSV